jgi:hypothetical protein
MSDFARAARGDLIVVERTTSVTFHAPTFRTERRVEYVVGRVTNITRDGLVKKYAPVGLGEAPVELRTGDRTRIAAKASIDVDGALDAARAHHYDGHPNHPKPFDSLEEVRALLAPFRKEV